LRRAGGLIGGFLGSLGGSFLGVFDRSEGVLFFAASRLPTACLTGVSIKLFPVGNRIQDQSIGYRQRNKASPNGGPLFPSRAGLQRERAFVFVVKEAAITQAGTAVTAIEFLGV